MDQLPINNLERRGSWLVHRIRAYTRGLWHRASWGRRREEGTVGGRPRLNLQPRTLPVGEGQKPENPSAVKPKTSNPFGAARPREEVLKEKGQDWKEIEEKLEATKMKEVVSEAPSVAKRSFWSGDGRDRSRQEDKIERGWRKPESTDSPPQSAGTSENGHAENPETEIGPAEEAAERDPQM